MHVQPRLVAAYRLLKEGSTAKAKAACRRVLRETPEDAAAMHLLGLIHEAEGDDAGAERFLRKSVELEPAAAGFRARLGDLLREHGRLLEAESMYREAIALETDLKAARAGLIRTLVELRQPAVAEAEARELTRMFASDPEAWSLLAMTVKAQGRSTEAKHDG